MVPATWQFSGPIEEENGLVKFFHHPYHRPLGSWRPPARMQGNSMEPIDLQDCQCPACKRPDLRNTLPEPPHPDRVYQGAIVCGACQATFDIVWGMPFLGIYEESDLLSLIEIAANAGRFRLGSA